MPSPDEQKVEFVKKRVPDTGEIVNNKPRTLTRSDIAAAIIRRTPGLSQREAGRILGCVLEEIVSALSQGEECVKLHDFGAFYVCEKTPRKGRNPLAGQTAPTSRRKSLKFRPSLRLKQKVESNAARGRGPRY